MKDFHFDAISAFENYEIEKMRDGHVVVTTKVVDSSLNYYGNAHGGYLFTLCFYILTCLSSDRCPVTNMVKVALQIFRPSWLVISTSTTQVVRP